MPSWDVRLLSVSYTRAGDVTVQLFGRTRDRRSITALHQGFKPYFYIVEPDSAVLGRLRQDKDVLDVSQKTLFVDGADRACAKVTVRYPWTVPEYRRRFSSSFFLAADIPFSLRFMYDHGIEACVRITGEPADRGNYSTELVVKVTGFEPCEPFKPALKILSFDIENSIKEKRLLVLGASITDTDGSARQLSIGGSEKEIVNGFIELVRAEDPDVITGYNIDGYDIPYLLERAKVNGVDSVPLGRDGGEANSVSDRFWRIHGRIVADAWWNAKRELRPKQETLDAVAKLVLGEGKADVDPSNIDAEWAEDSAKVTEYCVKDAELAGRILDKIAVLQKMMDLATVSKLALDDVLNGRTSTLIDSILIREADKEGIGVMMNRHERRDSQIEGGYVHTIEPGIYPWVCVMDFKCLHRDTLVLTESGYAPVSTLEPGRRILSDKGFHTVLHVGKARRESGLVITTESGNEIKVSSEHRFPTYMKKRVEYSARDSIVDKKAEDLKVGDRLIECYDFSLASDDRDISSSMLDAAELTGIFDAEGYLQESIHDRVRHDRGGHVQRKIRYTQLSFTIGSHELLLRKRIIGLMNSIFGSLPNEIRPKGSRGLTLQYGSHKIYEGFEEMMESKDNILSHRRLCRKYLRGLFTGDGNFNRTRKTLVLTQSVKNDDIINFAHKCLVRCGIPHTVTGRLRAPIKDAIHWKRYIEIPSKFVPKYMKEIGLIEKKGVRIDNISLVRRPERIREGYRISRIRSIKPVEARELREMYDVTLEGRDHPYFYANHILTHNSMYPSLIIAKNICFTTLSKDGTNVSPTGERFLAREVREGVVPRVLGGLMSQRDTVKKNMKQAKTPEEKAYYDGLQQAVKVLMNAFYGVFASAFYRFTNPKIGASITAFARENTKGIISHLESDGYKVIYGDTDSVFVQSPTPELEASVEFGKSISAIHTREGATLEFEKLLNPLFSHGAKKRYVGKVVWPEETIVMRGYETRRTDAFDLQSGTLEAVFGRILENDPDGAVEMAVKAVRDCLDGKIPNEALVVSRTCREESSYKDADSQVTVQAARKLTALGYEFVPGMKVSWIVVDGRKSPIEVEPYVSGRPFERKPDYEYYARRTAMTLARATEFFGWDVGDLLAGRKGAKQVGLFDSGFGDTSGGGSKEKREQKPGTKAEVKKTDKALKLEDFV